MENLYSGDLFTDHNEHALLVWLKLLEGEGYKSKPSNNIWNDPENCENGGIGGYADAMLLLSTFCEGTGRSKKTKLNEICAFKELLHELLHYYECCHSQKHPRVLPRLLSALLKCGSPVEGKDLLRIQQDAHSLSLRQLVMTLTQMVLVACITGPCRDHFLQRIMTLETNIQEGLMNVTQQVLFTHEGSIAPPFNTYLETQSLLPYKNENCSPDGKEQKWITERMVDLQATVDMLQATSPKKSEYHENLSPNACEPISRPSTLVQQELDLAIQSSYETENLSAQLNDLRRRNHRLQMRCSKLVQASTEAQTLRDEVDSLRPLVSRNQCLEDQIRHLRACNSQQRQELEDVKNNNFSLQRMSGELEKRLSRSKTKLLSCRHERECVQIRYQELQRQYSEVSASLAEANNTAFEAQQQWQRQISERRQSDAHKANCNQESQQSVNLQREINKWQKRCFDSQQHADDAERRVTSLRLRSMRSKQRWQLKVCSLRYELEEAKTERRNQEMVLAGQIKELTRQRDEALTYHKFQFGKAKEQIAKMMEQAYKKWCGEYKNFLQKLCHKRKVFAAALLFLQKEITKIQHTLNNRKSSPQLEHRSSDRHFQKWTMGELLWAQQALTAKYREQYFALNSKYSRLRRIMNLHPECISEEQDDPRKRTTETGMLREASKERVTTRADRASFYYVRRVSHMSSIDTNTCRNEEPQTTETPSRTREGSKSRSSTSRNSDCQPTRQISYPTPRDRALTTMAYNQLSNQPGKSTVRKGGCWGSHRCRRVVAGHDGDNENYLSQSNNLL